MYSILLVEDEKIELDTLKNYVDWKKCGIDQVYTARGGRSALQIVADHEPDIIITDIQMPGMSGIELAGIVRQDGYHCRIVFLTGYDRFEYAREALRLQADEFLLKPFDIDEVEAVTSKLVEKIRQESFEKQLNRMAVGEVLEKACRGRIREAEQMAEMVFRRPAQQIWFSILALRGITEPEEQHAAGLSEVIHAFHREEMYILILDSAVPAQVFADRLRKMLPEAAFQAVTRRGRVQINGLQEACDCLLRCGDDLFYLPSGGSLNCEDHREWADYEDLVNAMEEKKKLLQAVLSGDEEAGQNAAGECLEKFCGMKKAAVCQNAFALFVYLHRQMEKEGDVDGQAQVPNLLHAERYDELEEQFAAYVRSCCETVRLRQSARWSSFVKNYIRAHYAEDCTVDEMAEQLEISPNYLRRKFKEETGSTILEYLTDTRLEIAAGLLKEGRMKVRDVGTAVGYPNISYFTQLFAKRYGATPNEYKKMV